MIQARGGILGHVVALSQAGHSVFRALPFATKKKKGGHLEFQSGPPSASCRYWVLLRRRLAGIFGHAARTALLAGLSAGVAGLGNVFHRGRVKGFAG